MESLENLRTGEQQCEWHTFPFTRVFFVCIDSYLVHDSGHELWVRLLIGQELSDDLVHDILRREEVFQKLGQNPGHHAGFTWQTLPDPGRTIGGEKQNESFSLTPQTCE